MLSIDHRVKLFIDHVQGPRREEKTPKLLHFITNRKMHYGGTGCRCTQPIRTRLLPSPRNWYPRVWRVPDGYAVGLDVGISTDGEEAVSLSAHARTCWHPRLRSNCLKAVGLRAHRCSVAIDR
ncbi:hypothetical protein ElyMa_000096900 [Elysia marginata]|uniref:Uncharacterized protein n=1 Tax=Elysia marginata TaxID=1093978 RepID=A0AAV4EJ58_9GAST|nr:hypothetical protein ElyMa_000096900 [Elysia marginata]